MGQQQWGTNSVGGFLGNPRLSKSIRHASSPLYAFRQFVGIKEALGTRKGSTVLYDKIGRITTRGGTMVETNTFVKNTYNITQGSVQVTEYGNSVPLTGKLDELAEYDPQNITSVVLRDDQADTLDRAAGNQYTAADFVAVCLTTATTEFYTNGAATNTATVNMSEKNFKDVIDFMKIKKMPKYGAGKDYVSILSIPAERGVYDGLQAILQYTTPEFMYNNELGKYYGARVVEENNLLSTVKGVGGNKGEACFFGADAVIEAVALMEEIRYWTTDGGRDENLAWYGILGFGKMWDWSADSEEHQVFVTSVA